MLICRFQWNYAESNATIRSFQSSAFDMAQYGWKQWRSAQEAEQINDTAFNYVVNGNFKDSEVSKAFENLENICETKTDLLMLQN